MATRHDPLTGSHPLRWLVGLGVVAVLLAAAGVGAYYLSRGGSNHPRTAPAFSSSELAALPGENWITNGGSLSNARYSPLTEIDASNVGRLKGVWMTHLGGDGLAAKY